MAAEGHVFLPFLFDCLDCGKTNPIGIEGGWTVWKDNRPIGFLCPVCGLKRQEGGVEVLP